MPSPLDRRNQGARQPVGRPSLGITKKVSLTLNADEWAQIESSGLTVAAFLKDRMKESPVAGTDPVAVVDREPVNYPRGYVEERWDIFLGMVPEQPAADIINNAKQSMYSILYPKDAENAAVRIHPQFECPFTGKRYGSMDKLVRAAIPHLIDSVTKGKQHKEELAVIREQEKSPRYL